MDRREFMAAGMGGVIGAGVAEHRGSGWARQARPQDTRALFPRLENTAFLNAAAGTPLGAFADAGLERYMAFQRLGPGEGRVDYVDEMRANIRDLFAELIGARSTEIALVHSTKAGEQLVIDGFNPLGTRRNVVTNDMHFIGSLHNYDGLRRAGADIRIVRSRDWDVPVETMAEAIDDDTALVAVTLLSNVTGRVEPIRELADLAHEHGAYLYADIIQAAGVVPLDMRALGIDFAAANGYKWLYGVHGSGFLYVREELQGTVIPDRLFPGSVRYNYPPWTPQPDPTKTDFIVSHRTDASRYEPGHVSYLGYCSVYEGMRFIKRLGLADVLRHSVELNRAIDERIDATRYRRLTPDLSSSPILSYWYEGARSLRPRLRDAGVVVTLADNWIRISPAVYNDEEDVSRLIAALNA